MSLYNMIFGVNPSAYFLLPLIGVKLDDIPRLRDCFLSDDNDKQIEVMTRTGGGNRETYEAENAGLQANPNYVDDRDMDEFDSTYALFTFNVPVGFHADLELLFDQKLSETSQSYKDAVMSFWDGAGDDFKAKMREALGV